MLIEFLKFYRKQSRNRLERKILKLITHSYDHVPFYQNLLNNHSLTPGDFKNLEDYIEKFPRTTSTEYRAVQHEKGTNYMLDNRLDYKNLIFDRSSGSSGIPLTVYRSRKEKAYINAKSVWHYVKGGLRPWHRTIAVRRPFNKVERDSILQSLGIFRRHVVDFLMDIDDIIDFIERNKFNAIYGSKSFIALLADRYIETGKTPPQLEYLMFTSEHIDQFSRNYYPKFFKSKKYSEIYGATEIGIIAAMQGGDYEVNYNNSFFCLTNPVAVGDLTRGSIAATSLYFEAQPMLMIELGDDITVRNYDHLLDLKASIIKIDGRNNDFLVLDDGTKLTGYTFYTTLEFFPFLRQFRIIQNETGYCNFIFRLTEKTQENMQEIEKFIKSVLKNRLKYNIEYVDKIPMDPNYKTKIMISKIGSAGVNTMPQDMSLQGTQLHG